MLAGACWLPVVAIQMRLKAILEARLRAGAVIPEAWRDALYASIARNRYRWFGRVEFCAQLTPEQRALLL